MADVISGMVPNPKKTIYKLPLNAFPLTMAANTAIYTKPQGNKPFKKPMVKNVSGVFFLRAVPKADLIFEMYLKMVAEPLYLLNFLYGMSTARIISIPMMMESCCWKP